MEETRVQSSVIKVIGYDEETSTLLVVFRDGQVYEFYMVPRQIYEGFLSASSKGRFFNQNLLKGPYGSRKHRKK